ncbi:AAA family ATPase, partial [Candidatus Symbiothrix dinenymphae]|uniref:AAA family ATPase n=1 Tax=Candidatus Symbiothrix dinenymphae TaxID=467085 RepID=UPI000B16B31B
HYYDVNKAKNFETLFGELYIGKHPTPKKSAYAVLKFDFSGINTTGEDGFRFSFSDNIQDAVCYFLDAYRNFFPDADSLIQRLNEEKSGISSVRKIINKAETKGVKIFVIIDEYDHFANDLIAMGSQLGKDVYHNMVQANGLVRDFYEALKIGTKSVIDRIFITGISPVMLDDLTSGFNIAANLTLNPNYNEMMGFTQQEVDALMLETGVDSALVNVDMEMYYNGYLFHKDGEHRVYNPSMVLYIFNQILTFKKTPENIIDDNLKTDYNRLRRMVQNAPAGISTSVHIS